MKSKLCSVGFTEEYIGMGYSFKHMHLLLIIWAIDNKTNVTKTTSYICTYLNIYFEMSLHVLINASAVY